MLGEGIGDAMKRKWGAHPVLEEALAFLDEVDVPADLERAIPAPGRLSTRALVEVAHLCLEHVRPRVPRGQRAEFERLAALVARQLAADPSAPREAWQNDLHHAQRDFEHGRGVVKIAALAAQVASADVMRSAPGAGPEAATLAGVAVSRTARTLSRSTSDLHAFVRALAERVAALQT